MGFMNFLGKMVAGKPVFEATPPKNTSTNQWNNGVRNNEQHGDPQLEGNDTQSAERVTHGGRYGSDGQKMVAEVEVVRIKPYACGPNVDIWGRIKNLSNYEVFVDKISMFGKIAELDRVLRGGEEYEFRLYRGPEPQHDNYPYADLYYRDQQSNDYFLAHHQIHYHGGHDGKHYDVNELTLVRPIKDM